MKKVVFAGAASALLLLVVVFVEPSGTLRGWVHGERFFADRPASYWRGALVSEDPAAREEARQRLVDGGSGALPVLVDFLSEPAGADWESAQLRWTVAEILGEIGPAAGEAGPALMQALDDSDPHVRAVSASTLPAVGVPAESAVPALVQLLRKEPSVVVVYALSEYGPDAQPALGDLVAILTDQGHDTELRWNAARTLGKLRGAGAAAIPVLVEHLRDEAATVREHSAEALGDIGPAAQDAVPALIAVLGDPATRVRRDAARSLGQIGPAAIRAVPDLKVLLKDPEEIVRDAAATAVRALAPDEPLEAPQPASDGTAPAGNVSDEKS